MDAETLAAEVQAVRGELRGYIVQLTGRAAIADEIVQTTFLRALEAIYDAPDTPERRRFWLFRIATNLAIDERRRHSTWRETAFQDVRQIAESDVEFVEFSRGLQSSPEMTAIAREHLVACFACTLKNLSEQQAASLLLKEVHGFTIAEIANLLDSRNAQAKNWLQTARAEMDRLYASTCALVNKAGVCYQCVELDDFFNRQKRDPLAGTPGDLEARIRTVRAGKDRRPGKWHERLFEMLDVL